MPLQGVLVHVNCGARRLRVKPFTSVNGSQPAARCRGPASIRPLVYGSQALKVRRSCRVQAAEGTEDAVKAEAAATAADAEDTTAEADLEPEVATEDEDAEEEFEFKDNFDDKKFSDEEKALAEASRELFNTIEDEFEQSVRDIFKRELTTDESTSIFEAFGQLDAFTEQLTNMDPEKLELLLKSIAEDDEDWDEDDDDEVADDEVEVEVAPEAATEVVEAPVAKAAAEVVEAPVAEAAAEVVEAPVAEAAAEVVEAPVAEAAAEAPVAAEVSGAPVDAASVAAAAAAATAAAAAASATPAAYAPAALEVKALRERSGAGMMDCKKMLIETNGDADKALELLREKGLISAGKKSGRIAADGMIKVYVHPDARFGLIMEVNCETDFVATNAKFQELVNDLIIQCMPDPTIRFVSLEDIDESIFAKEIEIEMSKPDIQSKPENIREKMVAGRVQKNLKEQCLLEMKSFKEQDKTMSQVLKEAVATLGENIKVRRFERLTLGEGVQKKEANLAAEVAAATTVPAKPKEEAPAAAPAPEPAQEEPAQAVVQVAASAVKELREATGAGMMDCKRALQQNGGDMQKATEWLRKKGLASAAKKATRSASDGLIYGYAHPDGRFGILMEVNCETDFVASNQQFSELARGVIYNIASNKEVQFVAVEDIPADFIERERRIAMDAPELAGKPEEVKAKIVEGKLKKVLQSLCLLNQPYVYDQKKTVEDVLKEAVATLGENIKVRRFVRYDLGEGIQKKTSDLAAEVAAMTGN